MNGYKAFYKNKEIEIHANSSYEAQKKAAALFNAKKEYEVNIVLCEVNNREITHTITA